MAVKQELIKTSLRGSVTESGANTFTEQGIDTNLSIRGDHVYIVTAICWKHNAAFEGDGDGVNLHLAYASQSDIIGPSDPDFLFGVNQRVDIVTSGGYGMHRVLYENIDHFPIAVPQLYIGVKGASLGAAVLAEVKLTGYHVRVNTTEFFRLAQSR